MAENTAFSMAQRLQSWSQTARQVIDIRIALVVGLLAFMLAVSVDSGGNQAAAADLAHPASPAAVVTATMRPQPSSDTAPRPIVGDQGVSQRLYHGTITSAILTSSRMTEAHFFTDLPSGE